MKGRPEQNKLISDTLASLTIKSWESDSPVIASFLSEYWQPMFESQQRTYEKYPNDPDPHKIYIKHGKTVYSYSADCWGHNGFGVGKIARLLDTVIQRQEISVLEIVTQMLELADISGYLGFEELRFTLYVYSEVGYDNPDAMKKMLDLKLGTIVPYLWNGAPTSGIDKITQHRVTLFMEALRKQIYGRLQDVMRLSALEGFADRLVRGIPFDAVNIPFDEFPEHHSWRHIIPFWYEGSLTEENVNHVADLIAKEEWERCKLFIISLRGIAESLLDNHEKDAVEITYGQVKDAYDVPLVFYPDNLTNTQQPK